MALNIVINKSVATPPVSYPAGATVATAIASGGTAPYTYSLATGSDKFAINSTTGVVTTIAAMDIDSIASFSVAATDSTSTPVTGISTVVYPDIQAKVQNKFNRTNVIYKITKDIDLRRGILTIPGGCTLDLSEGNGIIFNGSIYISDSVTFKANKNIVLEDLLIIFASSVSNVTLEGLNLKGTVEPITTNKDLGTRAISVKNSSIIVSNISIIDCVISSYNAGIVLNGNNIIIEDNLLYNNGYSGMSSDASVDITASNASTTLENNNFIISRNRCLSRYVHRNIDIGELSSENNIIISENICVSSSGITTEDTTARKSHCIMVGYTGEKKINKVAFIVNNICKNSIWSGIYVRGGGSTEAEENNRYIALIRGNYIENVNPVSGVSYFGAIAPKLKDGSIISDNTIINCNVAMDLGFTFNKSLVKVCNNSIIDCNTGIKNDTFAYQIEIDNNTIKGSNTGIGIGEATSGVTELDDNRAILIQNNNIILDKNGSRGIQLYTNNTNNINVINNTIKALSGVTETSGIFIRTSLNSGYNISRNNFINLVTGFIDNLFDLKRNTNQNLNYNTFVNNTTGISITANSSSQLYIIEGNIFNSCVNNYNSQSWLKMIYEGKKLNNGTFHIVCDNSLYDYSNSTYGYIVKAEPCFLIKTFKAGDKISSHNNFTQALCLNDSSGTVDNDTKWRMDNVRLSTTARGICAVVGQMLWDSTLKKVLWYDGTNWIDATGATV